MRPLRHRDFRRLWLAGLISDSGDWLLLVALPILVYQLTGSSLQTSFAFLIELAPAVLLGPVAGHLADRWDRRRLLVTVVTVQAAALLPLLFVHDRGDLPILYAVIAVEAAALAVFGPARNALLPTLIPAAELVPANALLGFGQNAGRLVGGPLGGLLLAVSGLPVIVAVDLVTFLAAGLLIAGVAGGAREAADPQTPGGGGLGGRRVWSALGVAALCGTAQGVFVVLFVVWVARELGGGAAETGLLRGVQAIGAITLGLLLAVARRSPAPGTLIAAGAGAFGLLSLAVWNGPLVTTALPVYVALFILVGAPGVVMITGLVSLLQQETPDGARGKVFGVFGAVFEGSSGAGMLAAGLLADRLGVVPLLNGQALLYLTAAATATALLRPAKPHPATATALLRPAKPHPATATPDKPHAANATPTKPNPATATAPPRPAEPLPVASGEAAGVAAARTPAENANWSGPVIQEPALRGDAVHPD
ncbi:MFS transporter [Dactylosporangium maewongense]|uniref:MFS transporter n=1 Tax=Dactylosporangium maewongense TaxID=634393 RepID=A0ABN2CB19_9ACTN